MVQPRSNPWFDGGFATVAAGALLVGSAAISWWRSRRRQPAPDIETGTPADREISGPSPLLLLPESEAGRLFDDRVWAFAILVRITSLTDKPVTLAHYRLIRPDTAQRPPQETWDAVSNCTAEFSIEHKSELFTGEITVPAGGSITRWLVNWAYARPSDGGRPALTLQAKDVLNNIYEFNIPARTPKVFRSSQN